MTHSQVLAQVLSMKHVTDSLVQLIIKPEQYVSYQAGQYLQIMVGNEAYSYSIANAPLISEHYELHIRHTRDNASHLPFLTTLHVGDWLTIQVPMGDCFVQRLHRDKPILFFAAGTGFAPIKAMIEDLFAVHDPRRLKLFWGARSLQDLYLHETVLQWEKTLAHFKYVPHVSETSQLSLVDTVLLQHALDINDWQVVLSGPFDMVCQARDVLLVQGALAHNLFSDAFVTKGVS
jgi:CDP-4-dehydro-6-deoxyglucose reductase